MVTNIKQTEAKVTNLKVAGRWKTKRVDWSPFLLADKSSPFDWRRRMH
jgi:hypothetical protein